jgi:hypothetical protein
MQTGLKGEVTAANVSSYRLLRCRGKPSRLAISDGRRLTGDKRFGADRRVRQAAPKRCHSGY